MNHWFNIGKPINVIYFINKVKKKNHMTILIHKKANDKIQHLFTVKTVRKIGTE